MKEEIKKRKSEQGLQHDRFETLNQVWKIKTPSELKVNVLNQCILLVMTFRMETWLFTKVIINNMKVAQLTI